MFMATNMAEGSVLAASWQALKPMPTKRVYSTAVDCNGHLFVVGGCDSNGTPIDCTESYNPQNKKWSRLANLPTKRAAPCCAAIGKKIVALGGIGETQHPVDAVEVYDIEKKSWEVKQTMKDKLLGVSCVVRDGKIITVGGMGFDTNPKDYLMQYDVETDLWKALPPMPTARYATFSFLINNKLYVIGGRQGKVPVAAFEVFDFETNRWRQLPDVPSKRVFALYTHSDTHIFSMGGLHQDATNGFSDVTEVFDLKNESWFIGQPMSLKRGDFAVLFHQGQVIAAGGLGNDGRPLDVVESYDQSTNKWSSLPKMPSAACSCTYINFQNMLHVIGGISLTGPSAAVEALTIRS